MATTMRVLYARGSSEAGELVAALVIIQWVVIIGTAVVIARVWTGADASQTNSNGPWTRVRDLLGRHRLQIVLVLGYTMLILIVPTSSEQFFDAVRGIDLDSPHGLSAFGVCCTDW